MPRIYRLWFGIGSAVYMGVVAASLVAAISTHASSSGLLTEPWSMLLGYLYSPGTKAGIVIATAIGAFLNMALFYLALRVAYAQSWVVGHKSVKNQTQDNAEIKEG